MSNNKVLPDFLEKIQRFESNKQATLINCIKDSYQGSVNEIRMKFEQLLKSIDSKIEHAPISSIAASNSMDSGYKVDDLVYHELLYYEVKKKYLNSILSGLPIYKIKFQYYKYCYNVTNIVLINRSQII